MIKKIGRKKSRTFLAPTRATGRAGEEVAQNAAQQIFSIAQNVAKHFIEN
jgi:hypothetical protein